MFFFVRCWNKNDISVLWDDSSNTCNGNNSKPGKTDHNKRSHGLKQHSQMKDFWASCEPSISASMQRRFGTGAALGCSMWVLEIIRLKMCGPQHDRLLNFQIHVFWPCTRLSDFQIHVFWHCTYRGRGGSDHIRVKPNDRTQTGGGEQESVKGILHKSLKPQAHETIISPT